MEFLKSNLLSFGLSELEADIYLLLLKSSELTAAEIAESTRKKRTNIYPSLKTLISHTLVEELPKNRGFKLTHPTNLRNIIASEQLRIQQLSLNLESYLPKLINAQANTAGSVVSYPMKDGWNYVLQQLYQSGTKSVTHIRKIAQPPEVYVTLPRELLRRGIQLTAITPVDSGYKRAYAGADTVYKTQYIFLNPEEMQPFFDLLLTDTVACILHNDQLTICDNPVIVQSYHQFAHYITIDAIHTQKALEKRWKRLS